MDISMRSSPAVYAGAKRNIFLRCKLCRKICECSDDLVMHFAKHFAPGECLQCDQQLIEIGDQVYHLQFTTSCERKEPNNCSGDVSAEYKGSDDFLIKSEPEFEIHAKNEPNGDVHRLPIPSGISELSYNVKRADDLEWSDYPDETDDEFINNELQLQPGKKRRYRRKTPSKPRSQYRRPSPRTYECYICKTTLQSYNQKPMEKHLRDHHQTEPKPIPKCDICGKIFANVTNLNVHSRLHSGQKQFICSVCGKGFNQKINLKFHIVYHSGIKSFKCEVCEKAFGSKNNLNHHRRVHTGEKPYKCKIDGCQRAYMYSIDLKRHLYGAHGIYTKKYECTICGKILPENKLLVAHIKTHQHSAGRFDLQNGQQT